MKRFFSNIKKYKEYIIYSAVAELRAEQAGSYLTWVWWILEPFLFMMVYSFVALIIFGRSEKFFIPFVFIGYGIWSFFNVSIRTSVALIKRNKSVIARVYLPKYVLLLSNMVKLTIELFITLGLAVVMTFFYKDLVYTWRLVFIPLIVAEEYLIVFGICCIMMHCGVYISDLNNIIRVVLRLLFYLSGVFYNLSKKIPSPLSHTLFMCNPAAMLINEMRKVMLYGENPNFIYLGAWLLIGLAISAFGIHLIHKYEQSYVKAV